MAVFLGVTNTLIDDELAKYEGIIIGCWFAFYLVFELILEIVKNCASEGRYKTKHTVQDAGKGLGFSGYYGNYSFLRLG